MRTMQTVAACVLVLICVWGPDFSAQIPQPAGRRVLIVADELSIQFRSTPWTRELMSRIQRVLDGDDVVRVVLTGGARTVGVSADTAVGMGLVPRVIALAQPTSVDADELRLRSDRASTTVASALRSLSGAGEGPTIIVYFTEGYPAFVPQPIEFVQEALRLNATVYVMDPRGFSEAARQLDAKDWEAYVAATVGSLRTLARGTKGRTVFTRSEFDAVISGLTQTTQFSQ